MNNKETRPLKRKEIQEAMEYKNFFRYELINMRKGNNTEEEEAIDCCNCGKCRKR